MKIFLPYVVRVIILSTIILFTCKVNSQSDFLTQHIEDNVTNNGFVNTSITPVSSLTNAFVLANNNRRVSAGQSGLTSNANAIDLSAARALTATNSLTYYKQNNTLNTRINSSIWEYIGPAGGPNEMIVRGRYAVNLNGGTNSTTVGLSGISNSQNCIPFITGIRTNVATQGADSSTAIAYLENNTTLRVEKGSNTNNVIINITLVEFTGSNWTVLHGDSGNSASDTATITLRNNADGSGTATSINDWSEAIIFGQHRGDNNANGVNDAIADNWPLFQPGGSNQTVDWTFDANHDSNGTNRQFVHVLHNTNLTVTRFTDTQNAADESTINISSAGLTDVNQALIVGSSISSGGGQAYGRGWRNYYLKSSSEAAHWAHRNNNTMSHEIQIVDLSNLTSSSCSTTIASFPYNEGFETGLGDWSQDTTNDDRDWTRQSGGTPSNNTGPSAAHEGSFYVFTEGSNPNFNSEFNLISPCIDLTSETSASLSFYYHMYGTNMGTLDVEVSTDGGSTFGTPEWSISGEVQTSNAQAWEQATVVLDAYTGQVIQIRFSGLTGADFTSDMAIDDISVTTGAVVSTCSASTLTLPYTESFETGTNGWASGGTDASRINNPTNSFDNDYSLMIRSNSGNASSFCSPSMDITSYDKVDFDFYFTAINFEQDELFYVEYSDDDGTTWTIAKIFEAGDVEGASDVRGDFDINNSTIFYNKTVTLQSTDYTFSSNSRFRVRSAASDATDMVYIDNISITGVTYSNPTIGPGGVTNDLDLWLRADRFDGTTVGTDGSLVTAWIDNGRGNDARTKATGLEPIYRNSTARNINFNPVIDFENDPTTAGSDMTYIDPRDKVLQGTGGFNSDDIFMVVIPDPVISTAILPLDTFTSTDPTGNTFDEDVTGFGYGNYSQRFTNENFGYAIGTSNAAGNGYGRGVTNTAINYNRVHIMNTRHNASDSDMEIYMNANQIGTVTSDVSDFAAVNNTRYWLGRSQYFQGSFDGRIAEVITYRARKDDADATQERNRIQSYLAIKYGITLEPTITAGVIEEGNLDYVDSDGSVIWDVSASAGFNFDIAGIGRDDASGLDQRQSSSINS
ncbi:choice-of-anchor J domain-containing protein, partial [Winogradskyella jejuensis]